jgi:hypothetical protein
LIATPPLELALEEDDAAGVEVEALEELEELPPPPQPARTRPRAATVPIKGRIRLMCT